MLSVELIEAAQAFNFDPAQGWPAELTPERVAWLQTRRRGALPGDLKPDYWTWCKLLDMAIKDGAIEHTTRQAAPADARRGFITLDQLRACRRFRDSSSSWGGWGSSEPLPMPVRAPAPAPSPKHYITAPAFAAWLTAQGIEQSAHISAWCKSQGVAAKSAGPAPVLQVVPLVASPPLVDRTAPAPSFSPTKKPGDKWTPDALAELLRQFEVLTDGHLWKVSAAHAHLADKWGYKATSIKNFITRARTELPPAAQNNQTKAAV